MRAPWLSRSGSIAIAVSLIALAIFLLDSEATRVAEASCVPNRSSQWNTWIHDGWYRAPGQTVYGVEAEDIEEYNPYVYTSGSQSGFSAAWSMLQTSGEEYAQIGWTKEKRPGYSLQRWVFVEWYNDSELHQFYFPEKSVGSYTDYRVEYDSGTPRFIFYADDWWYASTPGGDSFAPTIAVVSGEIYNPRSQMPGGYGNNQANDQAHEWMYTARWKNSSQWLALNGTGYITSGWSSYFGQAIYNYWDIDIWDKSCQY
jgi:hypothetical protein